MAKLPSAADLSGPLSLRSGRQYATADMTAGGRGLSTLGQGIESVGADLKRQADQERTKQNAVDIARAEAFKTEGLLKTQNDFDYDPDYPTFKERAPKVTGEVVKKAANLIRDPEMRERWALGAQSDAARVNDGIFDRGTQTKRQAETNAFDDALEVNRRIYVDPESSDAAKEKARKDIEGAIQTGQATGLLTPDAADARRKTFIENADLSRGQLAVEKDPSIVLGSPVETVVNKIIGAESGGDANAKNPNSSASGVGQFTNGTWLATVRAHRPDLAGQSDAALLSLKSDPTLGREMTRALTQDNARDLAAAGIPITAGNLYLAHFAGIGGAKAVLRAGSGQSVASILGPEVMRANGFLSGMSAGDLQSWAAKKMDGAAARPDWYQRLSPEDRQRVQDQAQVRQTQMATAAAAQDKASYTAYKDSAELNILTGKVSSELDITNDPVLGDGDKASLLRTFRTQMDGALSTAAAIQQFAAGNLSIDPYDDKGRKTVDSVYDTSLKAVAPEQVQPLTEEIVRQTGVVPQGALNNIRAGIQSTDIAQVTASLQAAQRLSQINPAALGRRTGGSEVQTAADDFKHYVDDLNLSPDQAAKRVMDANDPTKRLARKAIEPAAKEFVKSLQDVDLASQFNDSWFRSDPSLGFTPTQELGIKADFLAIAEDQFYQANGDPDLAKSRAVAEMKRLYGVTDFGGVKAVVKHPPERYWPLSTFQSGVDQGRIAGAGGQGPGNIIGGGEASPSLDYAKKQLQADVTALHPDADLSSVQLVTTPETDAMVKRGELPGYAILYKDANGMYQTIPGKLWRPDVSKAVQIQQGEDRAKADAAVEFARGQQDVERGKADQINRPTPGAAAAEKPQSAEDILGGNDAVFGAR